MTLGKFILRAAQFIVLPSLVVTANADNSGFPPANAFASDNQYRQFNAPQTMPRMPFNPRQAQVMQSAPYQMPNFQQAPGFNQQQAPNFHTNRALPDYRNNNSFPFSNSMMPFGNSSNNSFKPFPNGNMPFSNGAGNMPFSNGSGMMPSNPMNNMFGNNNNSKMPFFPSTTNKTRKKAWGTERNIWPDFYTDFTDEAWDQAMSGPRDLGRMPGGWRFPYISMPDPVTVSDAITNQFPPIAEEAGNMADFSDWGVFD